MGSIQKPRIYKFDNVRMFAILLVVISSFADGYTDSSDMFRSWFLFASSFVAPLLIFLSGLLQKQYKAGDRFDLHRFSFYLIAGFALKLLVFGMRRASGEQVGLTLFGGATIEWYLFVLAMYMLTALAVGRFNRYAVITAALTLGLLVGLTPLRDELYLSRYFVFMPFYFAGYYLTPMEVRRFSHKNHVKIAGLVFTVIYFVMCFRLRELLYPMRMLFTGRNPYAAVPIEGCTVYHRLLCYGISSVMVIAAVALFPNRRLPLWTKAGQNAIGVYFWHTPLLLALTAAGVFGMIDGLGDPLWKLTVLTLSVVCALVLAIPCFSWPLRKLYALICRMRDRTCAIVDGAVILIAVIAAAVFHVW